MRWRQARVIRSAFAAAALTASLAISGCNIVAPAVLLVHGPPKTKAAYTLDPERTTVVLVDDRDNRIPRRSMRLAMAQRVESLLLSNRVLKDVISAESASGVLVTDSASKPKSITELGLAAGAKVVIYVNVDAFALSSDGQTYAPFAALRVTVVDCEHDKRLWPEKAGGYEHLAQLPAKSEDAPTSIAGRLKVETELAEHAGKSIAELFYKHESDRNVRTPN